MVYFSPSLDNRERAFGVTEKECVAGIWASLQLRAYLEGNRFFVRTDHDRVRWIVSIHSTGNTRLARLRLRHSELEFDVASKPGLTHWMADYMSWMDTTGGDTTPIADEIPVFALTADPAALGALVRGQDAAKNVSRPTVRAIDRQAVLEAQGKDPFCQRLAEGIDRHRHRIPLPGKRRRKSPAAGPDGRCEAGTHPQRMAEPGAPARVSCSNENIQLDRVNICSCD